MSHTDRLKFYLSIPLKISLEYLYQLITLLRRFSEYLGLTNKRNYEDIFIQLLHDKKYDEALKLAKQERYLDIDLVYKCKWRNSAVTVQSINSLLGKIQDKIWVINQCLLTVPMSYEACRCLLDHGLQESNLRLLYELGNESPNRNSDLSENEKLFRRDIIRIRRDKKHHLLDEDLSDEAIKGLIDFDNLNHQQAELCRCRQNLLRYEHSLLCYENILGDYRVIQKSFDHVFYDEFRRKSPLNNCLGFANMGDPRAVETCLLFFPDELSNHLLAILSNFPETLSPYQYRNLLPCLRGNETVYQWKGPSSCEQRSTRLDDWSHCSATNGLDVYLKEKSEAFETEFYEENQNLKKFKEPLTSELLTEWFISRALEMESRTLLLCNSVQLLHLGTELNVKNLDKAHDDLTEFDRIVYDCCTEDKIYLSYKEFVDMSELDRLILMTGDSQKVCLDRFRFYVIPYIQRREHLDQMSLEEKIELLRKYFRHLANTREQISKMIYNDLLDRIECDKFVAEWTKDMDDAIDEIGIEIKKIERERQAKEISSIAGRTLALDDFDACYSACQIIMKKNFHECWALCCQLGMHKKFNNIEAKYRLLAFALAHCNDPDGKMTAKILDHVIDLRKRDQKLQMAYLRDNM